MRSRYHRPLTDGPLWALLATLWAAGVALVLWPVLLWLHDSRQDGTHRK